MPVDLEPDYGPSGAADIVDTGRDCQRRSGSERDRRRHSSFSRFVVEGVLAATVDSDFPDLPDSLSGRIAIFTPGRFLWPTVRNANPGFVFDPVAIND